MTLCNEKIGAGAARAFLRNEIARRRRAITDDAIPVRRYDQRIETTLAAMLRQSQRRQFLSDIAIDEMTPSE